MTTFINQKKAFGIGHNDYLSPGPVGSIGGVNMTPRLRQSNPDMPMRWDPKFSHANAPRLGSNVTDGQHKNYDDGGGPARVDDTRWYGNRDFKTNIGWIHQDIRATDNIMQPTLGSTPDYSWTNKLATVYQARAKSGAFLPLPGAYGLGPGQYPANGSGPVLTNLIKPAGYAVDQPVQGSGYADPNEYNEPTNIKNLDHENQVRATYLTGRGPQRPSKRSL